MTTLIDRLFRMEEINGDGMCPTYLYRWTLLKVGAWALYLHHFVGDDWTLDLHDHPRRFVSVGLWGRYVEETTQGEREWRAPWLRSFPAAHQHRLRLINKRPCWTLVLVLRKERLWGFWVNGQWFEWWKYLKLPRATERKSCP